MLGNIYSYKQHNNIVHVSSQKQKLPLAKKTNFAVETKWIMIYYKVGYDHMQLIKGKDDAAV